MRRFLFFFIIFFLLSGFSSLEKFKKDYQELISFYEEKLNKGKLSQDEKIKFAQFCYYFHDYERVLKILEKEENWKAKELIAKSLVKLKRYSSALEIFEKIQKKPLSSESLYLYAQALEAKNLYPKALKIYEKVTPPFKKLAQRRIEEIKIKVEKLNLPLISQLLKESEGFQKKVKDEAALILLVEEKMEVTDANTSIWEIHVIEKILNDRGKKLAEVEIGYDSTYEKVKLEFARSITGGKIFYAGKNNIRDVSKYLNYPLYSNARAFIISIPNVEVGSIIEYKLKIYSSKLVNEDDFTIFYRLREEYPIYKASFKLIIPQERKIRFKFLNKEYAENINLNPVQKIEKDRKIYIWRFEKILPLLPESKRPSQAYINPTIIISSFKDWNEIYKWWYGLYKDKLKLSEEMEIFLKNYLKKSDSLYEKAKKIYEYVAKNIRYVAVEYGESGYEPHQAQLVFLNKYGDCKDQTILLVALLRKAGIPSWPVLISTDERYDVKEDFPALYFNHVICAIKIKNKIIFADPTAETTSFGDLPIMDQNRKVLVFFDDKGFKILKTPQFENSKIVYRMQIKIDDKENALIKRAVTSEGNYASYQRWYLKYTHPEKIKENICKKMIEISPFAKLIDYKIENIDDLSKSPILEYSFRTEKFLLRAHNLRIFPALDEIDLDYSLIGKKERRYPIDFKGIFEKEAEITIEIPSNLKLKYLPSSAKIDTAWFCFYITYQYDSYKNLIKFSQRFKIKKRFVYPQEYKKFRHYLKKVFYILRRNIILEKINSYEEKR